MPAFEYRALDAKGRNKAGVISADSERDARQRLKASALFTTSLEPAKSASKASFFSLNLADRITAKDLILITRQLSTMLLAATPVEEAVRVLAAEADKANVRRVLTRVRTRVMEGMRLSVAMSQEPNSFDPLFCAMLSAGESSGNLAAVLSQVADQREKADETKGKVQTAMIYPIALALVATLVVTIMMIFVVPRIVEQFASFGGELPLITKIVIGVSEFLSSYGLGLLVFFILSTVAVAAGLQQSKFKLALDTYLLRIPMLGRLIETVNTARFARALGTLVSGGSPVLEALMAAKATLSNLRMRATIEATIDQVKEGASLSGTLKRADHFPSMLSYMIAAGERSGELPQMLQRVADYLDREFDGFSRTALGLLEPLIVVVMGGIVGTIVVAIMLPILQLNQLVLN